ncbi:MAG: hypothetical protein H8E61_06965 [Bacteroidetes bacterium]|nr:hypothetical protein [Bacteroidota bacterium]
MEWYTAPMLPFLAIISAYSMYKIIGMLTEYVHLKKWIFIIGLSIGLISISFVLPYVKTIQDVTHPETKWAANKFGDYFKHLKVNYPDFTDFTVFHAGFNSHAMYYTNVFNEEYGFNINYTMIFQDSSLYREVLNSIKSGDKIMLYQNEILEDLRKKFDVSVFHQYEELKLLDIKFKNRGEAGLEN